MKLSDLREDQGWPKLYHGSETYFDRYSAHKGRPSVLRGDSFVYASRDLDVANDYGEALHRVFVDFPPNIVDLTVMQTLPKIIPGFLDKKPVYGKLDLMRVIPEGRMFVKDEYGNLQKDLLRYCFSLGYNCVVINDSVAPDRRDRTSWVFPSGKGLRFKSYHSSIGLTESVNIPVRKLRKVFHVGSMDASQKRPGSYEGSGLSVSLHPDEWRMIARGGVGGSTWTLTNPNGSFLDFHKINKSTRRSIIEWGLQQKFVQSVELYQVSWYDDELEDTMTATFDNLDDAEAEAEMMEVEVEVLSNGITGTPKLNKAVGFSVDPSLAFDMLVTVWVDNTTQLDGVWWNDRLDPDVLSAPRGVISRRRLEQWNISQS